MGAADGNDPRNVQLAEELGTMIGERGWTLVYGGGAMGLMGRVARACIDAGGKVIGIAPASIMEVEGDVLPDGRRLADVITNIGVRSMERRKAAMMDRAEGFVVLPGGAGTFAEAWPVLDTSKLQRMGMHAGWRKPVVFLAPDDFFRGTMQQIEDCIRHGYMHSDFRDLYRVSHSAGDALARLEGYERVFRTRRVGVPARDLGVPADPTEAVLPTAPGPAGVTVVKTVVLPDPGDAGVPGVG